MKISICSIRAVSDGAEAEISLEISNETDFQVIKGTVSAAMMAELGLPCFLTSPVSIDRYRCDEILRYMKLNAAIKKGIFLLGYAQNTARSLKTKLIRKGYPADIAEDAVEYLTLRGYIRESDEGMIYAENLANRKHYGKNRIKKEMFAKGFHADIIRETIENMETDFSEICAKRILAMGGASVFDSKEQKAKATAALLRYGFSYDDIKEAILLLKDE